MTRQIGVKFGNNVHVINVDSFPDECGICHKNVDPTIIGSAFVKGDQNSKFIEAVYQCTNLKCNSLIIGYYEKQSNGYFNLINNAPVYPLSREFDEEITKISNNFVTIYNQAHYADQVGLTMISGIGYRKALEFLVKDYLVFLDTENEDSIVKLPLGQCINKLENHRIKDITKRATWIGNDEAHYKRKWEDKDVTDLKRLIEITVHFIALDVSAQKYLEEMS